ncbi:hypothetical protein V6Z11_A11G082200 [Gossypium hirsutum]|uniref:RING-type E3 ubiquitin transferase n=1 Tax=Gossypium hirsutum TaxID=3635 RepID=A0A1U8K0U8_GOSHI|nr:E3 ubiquitin-protein ligase ATL4-like [Gossypium hirsutum]
MASPPPFSYGVMGEPVTAAEFDTTQHSHPSSSIDNVKPSLIILLLILSVALLVSVSLCRLLRRRCLLQLPPSSTSTITVGSSPRISPEQSPMTSLLDSLPLFTFSSISRGSNNGDCAVCLSKFEAQDQLRLLPLCCHAFHTHCIDTWLTSNQTCPLCRSQPFASDSHLRKVLLQSSNTSSAIGIGGSDSFRLEIGSISRRHPGSDSGEQRRSYSIGAFDYIIEEESEVNRDQTHRNVTDKEASLPADVSTERSWLKEYDRLSFYLSSRSSSFRSSGRYLMGSSRRSGSISSVPGDYDVEANRIGEEISEMFRWFSEI